MVPVLVLVPCFAIDIGYFFIVAANLVSASRNAVLYSGQGFVSPGQLSLPSAGSGSLSDTAGVAGLAGGDLTGLANMATKTNVQVCSKKLGITQTSSGYVTNCSTFPSGSLEFFPRPGPGVELWNADAACRCGLHGEPAYSRRLFLVLDAALDDSLAGGDASA